MQVALHGHGTAGLDPANARLGVDPLREGGEVAPGQGAAAVVDVGDGDGSAGVGLVDAAVDLVAE